MKKIRVKMIIDIIMYILFIILMGYHITGAKAHEIIGVITFIMFLLHNILNIKWYKTLFKGQYNFFRIIQNIINILLFISFIGIISSSLIISGYVFEFLNISTTMFGRELHMISTSWGYIFMSIHLGFHLGMFINKLSQKIKKSSFEYIYYLLVVLLCFYGVYAFVKLKLWNDLFLLVKFKFFDMNQSKLLFYLDYIAVSLVFVILAHNLLTIIRKKAKK